MSLKIAVVGLGHMGKIHFNKLLTLNDITVTAVVDVDAECVAGATSDKAIKACSGYNEAIGVCDGVLIASPTETHYEAGKAFLEAGKHVFMEKPVTVTPAQAQELVETAKSKNLVFQIGHLERFNPAFAWASKYVKSPVFIEATRVSPFTGRSIDVDVVLDLMIHDLDLVLSITGDEVSSLTAHGVCLMTDKLDAVNATIEFANGSAANISASRISPRKERSLAIYESDRSISVDLLQGKAVCILKEKAGDFSTLEFAAEKIDPVYDELTDFVTSIRQNTNPTVTGEHGLRALKLATRIKQYIADSNRAVQ